VPAIVYGRIVYPLAPVADPQGRNPKPGRPFVVVSTPQEIKSGSALKLVGITSELHSSPPDHYVALPYGKHALTRFDEACAALCTWQITLEASEVEVSNRLVRPAIVETIRERVRHLSREPK
jgi:hypothetical protein